MSEVSVNRDALKYLLDRYFELRASDEAHVSLLGRMRGSRPDDGMESHNILKIVMSYVEDQRELTQEMRAHNRYLEQPITDSLTYEDDVAFRDALDRLCIRH